MPLKNNATERERDTKNKESQWPLCVGRGVNMERGKSQNENK